MNPIIKQIYQCENCKSEIPTTQIYLVGEILSFLCCPNRDCELSGDVKVVMPARLGCPQPLVVTDFIIPGSMISLVMKKKARTNRDYAMAMGIGGQDEREERR